MPAIPKPEEPCVERAGWPDMDDEHRWIVEACLASGSVCPSEILEDLMADDRCAAFGPIHHFLDGAAVLTAARNAEGADTRDELLLRDLEALLERSSCVPGAACARWGVCGAAASIGMAYAVLAGNAPLRAEGWSEGQLLVARSLERIAHAGSPRCCKRDSRIAVDEASRAVADELGYAVVPVAEMPVCASMEMNSVCMGSGCVFHPDHKSA